MRPLFQRGNTPEIYRLVGISRTTFENRWGIFQPVCGAGLLAYIPKGKRFTNLFSGFQPLNKRANEILQHVEGGIWKGEFKKPFR